MVKVIIPVIVEPVALSDVKQHLRLMDEQNEDLMLLQLISTAREYCEHFTRRAVAEQTLELLLDQFPKGKGIPLASPPLREVISITYRNDTGTEIILTPSDYVVDVDTGQVVSSPGIAWPVFSPFPVSPIRIRYMAGYDIIPNTIRQALLMLVGHWYENREATGTASGEIAFSVHALLAPYRVEAF